MTRILIAEDEPDMQKILRLYLEKAGYTVTVAGDGEQALEQLYDRPFDLLIADWMMPKMDGIALCKAARGFFPTLKIIMLTAKGEAASEAEGLTQGADDYVKKPFDPKVLLLRVSKLLGVGQLLQRGGLSLNPATQTVREDGRELRLTQKEYLLLETFLRNLGVTLTREALLGRVWGLDYQGDERTLDTHIRRLRGKLATSCIRTCVGVGYRMDGAHE